MTADVVTLFPSAFVGPLEDGMLSRARRSGRFGVRVHDLRRFGVGGPRQVDDAPYGGGAGMVLRPEPLFEAVEWIRRTYPAVPDRVVLLSPQGVPFDHRQARRLAGYGRVILLCGRYEGVDERVREALADEEASVADVVLTGGEVPALAVLDGIARFVPGVLGNPRSADEDSFEGGRLAPPQWTRPAAYRGMEVPEVLLSGDHAAIARWRERRANLATRSKRPDLLQGAGHDEAEPDAG
jgi:tRNA (guanine37-N1)-methyltransferase